MKGVVIVIVASVVTASVQAEELASEKVCEAWVRNATTGAMHAFQNQPRKLVPLTVTELSVELTQDRMSAVKGIPVVAEEYATEMGKLFLEESVFYGFDYMQRLPSAQRGYFLIASYGIFAEVCERNVEPYRDSIFVPANRGHVLTLQDLR